MVDVFQGNVNYFPKISVDYFIGSRLKCLAFFLSHCHTDHIKGLDSVEFKTLLYENPTIKIYSTQTTASLVIRRSKLSYLKNHFTFLNEGDAHTIVLANDETLNVTLIPAHHCPGSVMFMFSNDTHRVLYTGDFRYLETDKDYITSIIGERELNSLYVDTTFYTPKICAFHKFPSRNESESTAIQFVTSEKDKHPNLSVHIDITPGWENIFIALARHFDCDIGTTESFYSEYEEIEDVVFCLATSGSHWIHVNKTNINCSLCLPTTYKLRPSVQWILHNSMLNKVTPIAQKSGTQNEWYITHSMHSSYNELKAFIKLVSADRVYPIATPPKMTNEQIRTLLKVHWKENPIHILSNNSATKLKILASENMAESKLFISSTNIILDHDDSDISNESDELQQFLMFNDYSTDSKNMPSQKEISTTRYVQSIQDNDSSHNVDIGSKNENDISNLCGNRTTDSSKKLNKNKLCQSTKHKCLKKSQYRLKRESSNLVSSSDNDSNSETENILHRKRVFAASAKCKFTKVPHNLNISSTSGESDVEIKSRKRQVEHLDSSSPKSTRSDVIKLELQKHKEITKSILPSQSHKKLNYGCCSSDNFKDSDLYKTSKWIFSSEDDDDFDSKIPNVERLSSPKRKIIKKQSDNDNMLENLYNKFIGSDSDF